MLERRGVCLIDADMSEGIVETVERTGAPARTSPLHIPEPNAFPANGVWTHNDNGRG